MSKEEFKMLEKILLTFFVEKNILVSPDYFKVLSAFESEFKFIKCDALDQRLICFGAHFPISNVAVSLSDIYKISTVISDIMLESKFIAHKNLPDVNQISIRKNSKDAEFVTLVNI